MDECFKPELKRISHFGIIAAIFAEYKIIDRIDALLPKKSNNQKLSHGQLVLAMVLQGLGFENRKLYLSKEFFSHIDLQAIFGDDVKPEDINANAQARCLDAIFEYGSQRFFTDVTLGVVLSPNILKKFLFMDTTSFHVTGKKYKNKGSIELRHGHSKDYRPDLRQLVYLLVASEDGLPILVETFSGNTSDRDLFHEKLVQVNDLLADATQDRYFVLNSSLYSKRFLKSGDITGDWITRVPESIKSCESPAAELA